MPVDGEAFLRCGLEDVFEGREVFGEVLGEGGGGYFEVCEANLAAILAFECPIGTGKSEGGKVQ